MSAAHSPTPKPTAAPTRQTRPQADGPVVWATRGLPGSGKTAWATTELARLRGSGVAAGRISRDDVRRLLGVVSGRDEPAVTTVQHAVMRAMLATGCAVVIVDDTHLTADRIAVTEYAAYAAGAGFELVDHFLDVPLPVCIARDAARPAEQRVGAAKIRQMQAGVRNAPRSLDTGEGVAPVGRCRICGCTEDRACPGGCGWVPGKADVCTACWDRAASAVAGLGRRPGLDQGVP